MALGIPIAAGILHPLTGWLLSPMIAALAISFSSVSVISNAFRLRGIRLRCCVDMTAGERPGTLKITGM